MIAGPRYQGPRGEHLATIRVEARAAMALRTGIAGWPGGTRVQTRAFSVLQSPSVFRFGERC
ncbi:MAG TPA: hypothetical protein DDZ68_06700 [Parvularcula sp.]|nr:hypothetical protein [Parvularcula sp.]HBS32949.1 hypothetical protein [Parvularcula sp.]HBS36303.1 hypothetical protein [Parvularcula sp.]